MMESQQLLGFGMATLGELLIGFSILRVHWRVSRERKIDRKVVSTIHTEEILTVTGMVLILFGFLMKIPISTWTRLL